MTIGTRIAQLRKEKNLTQEDVANKLGVSPQAVSKWENDMTCPDISLLPSLAFMLGVTTDELLTGKNEDVKLVPPEERKPLKDMILRIMVDSDGDTRIRLNLPMELVQMALEVGIEIPEINGGIEAIRNIDLHKVVELVSYGVVGNILEMTNDGTSVRVFVE